MVQKSEVLRDKKIVITDKLRVLNETQRIAVLFGLKLSNVYLLNTNCSH